MKAEIISIGTELLMGEILNTNAKYIAEKLQEVGVDLLYQTTVGDNETRITECLDIAFSRVDIVITTGGLGPTIDDRTKEVVSKYYNKELVVMESYYDRVVEKYNERGYEIVEGAKKESSIIKGSKILNNSVGLAPGFLYENDGKKIFVLPGPPKEMEPMMNDEVLPHLKEISSDILLTKIIEVTGVPEGRIDEDLKDYFNMSNPTVAPYAKEKSIHIRVAIKGEITKREELEKQLDDLVFEIKSKYSTAIVLN